MSGFSDIGNYRNITDHPKCLIIRHKHECGIDKNITANNIDKVYPTGATLDNKQQRIVNLKPMKKYTWPKKNERNVICLCRYAWDIKNSTTKFSKTQFVYSFNTEKELDKILSKLNPKHQKSRESDMEK